MSFPDEKGVKDYPSDPKTFGEKLRKTRMDKGLKVKELAEILGVTPDTVINWELRGTQPRGKGVRKRIKKLMNVSEAWGKKRKGG